jgi:hypothetical protein
MPIDRRCNGGPNGSEWCGKPATVVCTSAEPMSTAVAAAFEQTGFPSPGLQWYACADHTEGAKTEPIAQWFERNGL